MAEGIKLLEAILICHDDDTVAMKLLARAKFLHGDHQEAIEWAQQYIRLTRETPTPLCYLLGRAYWALNQKAEAKHWMDKGRENLTGAEADEQ